MLDKSPIESEFTEVLSWLPPLARRSGLAILDIYHQATKDVQGVSGTLVSRKADDSPLTRADLAAHQMIVEGLRVHRPTIPIVSEESYEPEQMLELGDCFWLVDPLDGTKEFLAATGEFTVNIALISGGASILGVVYQPVTGDLFWGGRQFGAYRQVGEHHAHPIHVNPAPSRPWQVMASRSHLGTKTQSLIERMGDVDLVQAGSSLKFCRIATGEADFYPRLGFTSQWDTAAAQAVLEGAGGYVIDEQGNSLSYGQPDIINPHFLATALPYQAVKSWWHSS